MWPSLDGGKGKRSTLNKIFCRPKLLILVAETLQDKDLFQDWVAGKDTINRNSIHELQVFHSSVLHRIKNNTFLQQEFH